MAEFSTLHTSSLPSNERSVQGNRELGSPDSFGLLNIEFDLQGAHEQEVPQEHPDDGGDRLRQEAPMDTSPVVLGKQSILALAVRYEFAVPEEMVAANEQYELAVPEERVAANEQPASVPFEGETPAASPPGPDLRAPERARDPHSMANSNSFTVAKVLLNQSTNSCDSLEFSEAIEPVMELYLEECCSDGPSAWVRSKKTAGVVLSLLFWLPLFSFVPLLIPFSAPHEGFVSNWAFNFLARPILNYVPARTNLELVFRAVEPTEKHRLRWIIRWVPLVECMVCLLIHATASFFGIFPLPYSTVTGCLPGIIASTFVARQLMPKDLLTPEVLQFMKFVLLAWNVSAVNFLVLVGYLLVFPFLPAIQQALLSVLVTGMLAVFGFAMEMVAVWMGLPKYHATELKPMLYFISFFFIAILYASAKNGWIFVFMLVQDAGKALAILCRMWIFLSTYHVRPVNSDEKKLRSMRSRIIRRASTLAENLQRLRHILVEFRCHTRESLRRERITATDALLLANFVRFLVVFCMVDLCEILVPLLYIIVVSVLHIPGIGENRQYMYVLNDMSLESALYCSLWAFGIEIFVFLMIQVFALRALGLNLWYFVGTVLRIDFWYWTFAFSTCCICWTLVLIAHAGHDLELFQSLLSF